MENSTIIILLVVGCVLLIGSVLIRVLSSGKYEIKTIDLAFIVVPLLLVGIATGQLKELNFFGIGADISKLFRDAANKDIKDQVGQPPVSSVGDVVELIETAPKRGVNDIPTLIKQKTEALSFRLGMGGYDARAIQIYFEKLYGSSYLKFIVIENRDETLYGVYPAADLIAYLRTIETGYNDFQNLLNRGDDSARDMLARLPGFIPAESAIATETTKREALESMDKLDRNTLPVVDSDHRFIGTVERAKVISSLLLAVTTP